LSNYLTFYWFLKYQHTIDPEKWFSVKDISKEFGVSIDRTRKHLSLLSMNGDAQTKVDGWCNVYKYRR